jgi:hypothetical protein
LQPPKTLGGFIVLWQKLNWVTSPGGGREMGNGLWFLYRDLGGRKENVPEKKEVAKCDLCRGEITKENNHVDCKKILDREQGEVRKPLFAQR